MLTYYTELDAQGNGKARLFNDMDLDQLRDLAEDNAEQTKLISHVYYFIFLRTGAMKDLTRAIHCTEGQIPVNVDSLNYAPRLKDLIIMLIKRYKLTYSPDDLQEAIFCAQEMFMATPLDHPNCSAQMGEWINMMFTKFNCIGSQSDLNEAIVIAQ